MGISLKISQIIAPLKNVKLVVLALVANFMLVPIVALLITLIIPLNEPACIGSILLATAAGAPFFAQAGGSG
jgi:BASS family bile acid:Na+ symporter